MLTSLAEELLHSTVQGSLHAVLFKVYAWGRYLMAFPWCATSYRLIDNFLTKVY